MSSVKSFGVALVTGALLLAMGCVNKDPIVTGHRDASTTTAADAAVIPAFVVPQPDDPDVDAPDCRHCGETLSTDTARGTLCRKNSPGGGPSSVQRLNALVDCLCYDKCVTECTSYCAGSKREDPCNICLFDKCVQFINACTADQKE